MNMPMLLAQFAAGGLVSLLIWLLVFALCVYVVYLILGMLPIPEPAKQIVCIILAVILLLVMLQRLGIMVL
jgi:hypothetical protein